MFPSRLLSAALVLALLLQFIAPLPPAYAEDPPGGTPGETTQLPPPPPVKKSSPKLEGQLTAAVTAYDQGGPVAAANAVGGPTTLVEADNLRLVLETDPAASAAVEAAVQAAGGTVESRYEDLVQVFVPFNAIKGLEQEAGVRFIRFPHVPHTAVLSEGVARTGASFWHGNGLTGAGVKVAIVDLGFTGYQALLGTELPASVTVQCFCSGGDINGGGEVHGTAVAEIVHDMAPDAQLYLVRVDNEVNLGNAVGYLVGQGVKVVNHSVGWFNTGGGDGTGIINDIVATASANGILWVNSSGNSAQQYWEGTWNDSDGEGYHNFAGSDNTSNVTIPGGACATIYLSWNGWPASTQDYDLYLWNSTLTTAVASSVGAQTGTQKPREQLTYCSPSTQVYHIAIYRLSAIQSVKFRMFLREFTPQYTTAAGSLLAPADSPYALSVGAVAYNQNTIENFSSRGPTQDGRIKPDLVGPDGVSTVSYGAGVFDGFSGTSASSPHVAGAAALVLQVFPAMTPAEVQAYLEHRGADIGTVGKDNIYGSGHIGVLYDGMLDLTFGVGGKVTTAFYSFGDARAMAVQPDGKIVAAGWNVGSNTNDFVVVRYTASGALDPTFGVGGKTTTDFTDFTDFNGNYVNYSHDYAYALALQPDGKIVAAGYIYNINGSYDFALVRYTASGALDPTFGVGGKTTTDFNGNYDGATALALQPDGKIVAAGTTWIGGIGDFALVRYTASGALDPTFGTGGTVTTDFGGNEEATALVLQPDGKVVVAGGTGGGGFAVVRYTASGVLDPTFGSGGKVITGFVNNSGYAYALALQSDGKIVAGGGGSSIPTRDDFAIVRYTASGVLDPTFGTGGTVTTDFGDNDVAYAVALQPDGKIVAAGGARTGSSQDFAVVRYLASTPGALQFSSPVKSVAENGGSATITATRSAGNTGTVSVTAATITNGGSFATSGVDYTATSVTLSWADGDTAPKTFTVPITNDAVIEPSETINLILTNPTGGATLGLVSTAALTIVDDDVPQGAYATALSADSPRGYWRLHEASGTAVADSSGNGNNGVAMNGAALNVTGALPLESDGAAQLDGVNDFVTVLDSVALSPTAAVSVEAWVNLTAYSGSYPRLLSKPGSYELTMYTGANADGRLEWKVSLAAGDVLVNTVYADRLLLGQWYHVAATYDGANLRVYINGVQKAVKAATGAVKDGVSALTVSRADRPIAAKLDEVAVYGTALSPTRVVAHYNAAIPAVAYTSGNGQAKATGLALNAPFVVTVTDDAGDPVPDMAVTWEITGTPPSATGQALSVTAPTTNASGQASATLTLGDRAGTYTVRATATAPNGQTLRGSPITFTAEAQTASVYAQAVLSDSPRAYWRLNEASGTQADDLSGNANTGAYLNGVTLGAAGALPDEAAATAVTLDGVNDLVSAPDSASLSPTTAVSVEAWVKLTAYTGSYPRLLSKIGSYELTMYTGANANGRLEWKVSLAGGDVLVNTLYADRLLLGQWYHVAATYDGANLRIYINGVQKAVKAATGAVKDGTSAFTISRADRPIAASMDEVAVYGSALLQARVQAHYALGAPSTPPSQYVTAVTADTPAGYWRLNEASGTSAADGSGNSNTGTYTNGVVQGATGALTSESDAAAQFDGVNDFVRVPDAAGLSPTAGVSVEAWVNLTAYSGSYPRLLSKPGAYELTMYTGVNADGRLEWKVSLAGGDVLVNTLYADRLLLGQWYHVAATYDGANLRIYINGVQKAVKAATGAVKDGTSAFTISRADRALAAKLDEVAVYGTALPLARVQAHYAAR